MSPTEQSTVLIDQPLSPMARLSLRAPNANVAMVATHPGTVELDEVETAVAQAARRHPLSRVRIALDENSRARYLSRGVGPVRVGHTHRTSDTTWIETVGEEQQRPFDITTGPLTRLHLVGGHDRSELIAIAHHSVCDGLSLAFLLEDVAAELWSPEHEPSRPVMPVPLEPRQSIGTGGLLSRLVERAIGSKWRKTGRSFTAADAERLHEHFWAEHDNGLVAWTLDADQTSRLVEVCRRHDITVTEALTAAFLLAADADPESRGLASEPSIVAVNLRDRLATPPGRALGFYAGGARISTPPKDADSVVSLARRVSRALDERVDDATLFAPLKLSGLPPELLDALWFTRNGVYENRLASRLLRRMSKDDYRFGLLLSNLGRLPASPRSAQFDSFYGPVAYSDTATLYLGVVTARGRLTLSLSYPRRRVPDQLARSIGERAVELMTSADPATAMSE